jgi:hypothetical protein
VKIAEYKIPERNLEALRERLESLNKRCKKLGFPEIKIVTKNIEEVASERWVRDPMTGGRRLVKTIAKVYVIEIEGEAPKYAGWEFAATLEHEKAGNVIRCALGAPETPERYRTARTWCDHCNLNGGRKHT